MNEATDDEKEDENFHRAIRNIKGAAQELKEVGDESSYSDDDKEAPGVFALRLAHSVWRDTHVPPARKSQPGPQPSPEASCQCERGQPMTFVPLSGQDFRGNEEAREVAVNVMLDLGKQMPCDVRDAVCAALQRMSADEKALPEDRRPPFDDEE